MSLFLFHSLACSFFSSPLLKPLVLIFFFLKPLHFCCRSLSLSLLLSSSSSSFEMYSASVRDRRKRKKKKNDYTELGFWFWSNTHLLFSLSFLLYLFCRNTCQDGKSSLSLVWQCPRSVYNLSALTLTHKNYFTFYLWQRHCKPNNCPVPPVNLHQTPIYSQHVTPSAVR